MIQSIKIEQMFGGKIQMIEMFLACSDETFKGVVLDSISSYGESKGMGFDDVWDIMFSGEDFDEVLEDRVEVILGLSALLESATY
jgi:hypothetical protein